jgi:hypothetical protein
MRRAMTIAAALGVAIVVAMAAIEVWVRATWDHTRGTPGIFLSDATRGQRLSAGYAGWFAGVPVRINNLGFRDPRDYALEKPRGTFRILVFGDSVTFGHGATFETTYPFLLEQRLRQWRADIQWQVWNLGVPGYNTRQELTYLREVGSRFDPDLVVIGFYPNDFTGNEYSAEPGGVRTATAAALNAVQRHLYSYEFYKRAYLTARWQLSQNDDFRRRLEHLQTESDLLTANRSLVDAPEQRLTAVDYFDDNDVRAFRCDTMPPIDETKPGELAERIEAETPAIKPWLEAVRELQHLAASGVHRIVFFINVAPDHCQGRDRFYNGGSLTDDGVLRTVLGRTTAVASSAAEFLHYRPSQMPLAGGHSLGNSNRVKADALFSFLQARVLPELLAGRAVE